jgi:hypothetical protein
MVDAGGGQAVTGPGPRTRHPAVAVAVAWATVAVTVLLAITAGVILWPGPLDLFTDPWMLAAGVFAACGTLIVTRRPTHPIGWAFSLYGLLVSAALVSFALAIVWSEAGRATAAGWGEAIGNAIATLAVVAIPAALLRFPDGSLLSRGWRWASWAIGATAALGATAAVLNGGWGGDAEQAIEASPLRSATQPWGDIASQAFYSMMFVTMALSGASLIMRFRHARGEARQQMKWLAMAAAYLVATLILALAVSGTAELDHPALIVLLASAFASIPAAVAVAVLRHGLYDIDRIINRTIVYTLVTGSLVAVYAGTVFVAGTVAVGRDDNLTVAAATLVAAAVFRPVLRRVQGFVDRRFYRHKYDAQKTIDAFGTRLRQETDLNELTDDLVGVVRTTMQPSHISVWLKHTEVEP